MPGKAEIINYTYTASKAKLRQQLGSGDKGSTSTRRDYAGRFVFVNNAPAWVSTPHGRFVQVNGSWENEFHLRYHLGNTRVVLMEEDTGTLATLQQNHYYPFGMLNPSLSIANTLGALKDNRYLYNGKELQDDFGLNWYDYGARFYDAQIGRWHVVDPLVEQRAGLSPYNFVQNNPLNRIDPTGLLDDWVGKNNEDGTTSWYWDSNITSLKQAQAAGYDDYRAPGSIIDNVKINGESGKDGKTSVYLGYSATDVSFTWPNSTVTPFQVGTEWLSGKGPRHRDFTNGDYFTELLKQHEHIEATRNSILDKIANGAGVGEAGSAGYSLDGIQGVGKYVKDYSTLLTAGHTGNLAVTYLGSYRLDWKVTGIADGSATVLFTVNNTSTMQSASRPPIIGYWPIWQQTVGKGINSYFSTGWGSQTSQSFNWTETLKIK